MTTTGYISGVWDLFHYGHLRVLQRSRAQCDFLVAGVAEDEYVFSYKEHWPIIPLRERMSIVSALRCVDAVMSYCGPGDMRPLQYHGVTVRFVGPEFGRYPAQRAARAEQERLGVRFVMLPRTPCISTTLIRRKCCEETAR